MLVLYRRQTSAAAADSMIVCDAGCRWHHMRHRLWSIAAPTAAAAEGATALPPGCFLCTHHLALS